MRLCPHCKAKGTWESPQVLRGAWCPQHRPAKPQGTLKAGDGSSPAPCWWQSALGAAWGQFCAPEAVSISRTARGCALHARGPAQ